MPWEKSFDEDNALEAAMNVFWAKGYEETSMSDLINAMNINKGSLYNAYGDKKTLFLTALKKYDAEQSRAFIKQLHQIDDPVEAINSLFDCMIQQYTDDPEAKGCLLVNTSLKLIFHDQDVQDIVKEGLKEVELFFETCLKKLKDKNESTNTLDTKETAKMLTALAVGLRVLSRGTFEVECLHAIKRQALKIIS